MAFTCLRSPLADGAGGPWARHKGSELRETGFSATDSSGVFGVIGAPEARRV
jgi:hypothetical protein